MRDETNFTVKYAPTKRYEFDTNPVLYRTDVKSVCAVRCLILNEQ
jgi:hypothetical protein